MTAHKAVLKIGALRGANRPIPVIVQHEELDGQVQAAYSLQLLAVHLKSAIAINRDGALLSGGDAGAQRGRDSKAHRPETFRVENPHSGLDRERLHGNFAARSGTAGHQQIVTAHLFGENLHKHVVVDVLLLFPILREHDRDISPSNSPPAHSRPTGLVEQSRLSAPEIRSRKAWASAATGTSIRDCSVCRSPPGSISTITLCRARAGEVLVVVSRSDHSPAALPG